MKKTIISAALLVATTSAAQATVFDFAGTFQMRDPTGVLMHNDTTLLGIMDMDMVAGTGTASISSTMPFFGSMWTAHNITFAMTGPDTGSFDMLFDWASTTNIHVTVDMGVTIYGDIYNNGYLDFVTLDGPSVDGIPGNPMDNGPFPMFNAAFLGTATENYEGPFECGPPDYSDEELDCSKYYPPSLQPPISTVPVPAAVWLFGSGLIGLVGLARRKKA